MSVSKEALFAPRLPEEDIDIPGVGTVRVRGLNRFETLMIGMMADIAERDRHLVALGMVDPRLSIAEARRWGDAAPGGELELVTRKIAELSGMTEGADKAAYKSDGGEPGPGVRDVPGAEAGDDGGPATGGDVGG